jgi:hypothetical protein
MKNIFCAKEQKVTPHTLEAGNGEVVATCKCGHFLKIPGTMAKPDVEKYLARYEESNQLSDEQIAANEAQAKAAKLVETLAGGKDEYSEDEDAEEE